MVNAVMSEAEASALFDQLEREDVGDALILPEGVEEVAQTVTYPKKLPGKKVRIFDSKTGVGSEVLPYMVPKIMKFKNQDGTPRFSRERTKMPPVGTVPCFLHAEHPDHEAIRAAGIVVECRKKLLSVMHAERHAKTRHADNWNIWQRAQQERRDAEAREREDRQYQAMMALAGMKPEPAMNAPTLFYCGNAGCARFFDSEESAKMHRAKCKEA